MSVTFKGHVHTFELKVTFPIRFQLKQITGKPLDSQSVSSFLSCNDDKGVICLSQNVSHTLSLH